MKGCFPFARGQIWLWEDPICGYKSAHKKRPEEDGSVRYSRYVVIVQQPTEENDQTVLCIPFSSKSCGIHEFQVAVQFTLVDQNSYGRIDKLFPANRKHLVKYICAMDDVSISQMNQKLLYVLGLVEYQTVNNGIRQVEKEDKKASKSNVPVNKSNVVSLNQPEVVFSGNKGEDMDKRILLAAQGKENIVRIPSKRINRRWNDKSRKEFCTTCVEKGVNGAASQYGLKLRTAENYYKSWSKLYDIGTIIVTK